MDQEPFPPMGNIDALMHLIGIKAGVLSYAALAKQGLVSPKEVEEYLDGLTDHLQPESGDGVQRAEQIEKLRASVESVLLPLFAVLREHAARNWKGG